MKWFSKQKVALGEGYVTQYTIFEAKTFGGIWLYNWKTIDQMRFHTHAFSSVAFTLRGSYTEEVLNSDGTVTTNEVANWLRPRYIPSGYCHRIQGARKNTWTIVFFGPWRKSWWEFFPDTSTWVQYGWGRKILGKMNGRAVSGKLEDKELPNE